MREEKVLKKQEGTEEEDDFNGLGRKRNCGRRNNFKRPRKKLFQNTGGNAGPTACSYKLFNTTGGFHFNSYLCIQTGYFYKSSLSPFVFCFIYSLRFVIGKRALCHAALLFGNRGVRS